MKTSMIARSALAILVFFAVITGYSIPSSAAAQAADPPDAAVEAAPLDINKATVQDLCSLPGIGLSKAEAIVAYRAKNGAFARIEDLLAVQGIGEKLLGLIGKKITIKTH